MMRISTSAAFAITLALGGVGLGVTACGTSAPATRVEKTSTPTSQVTFSIKPATSTLHLIHLGDTEAGMLADLDSGVGGVARARAVVDALRTQSGNALVVHSGDTMIPAPELSVEVVWPVPATPPSLPVDATTTTTTTTTTADGTQAPPPPPAPKKHSALLTANNQLGVQAAAVGNHDFDLGESFFADAVKGSGFPFVSSTLQVQGGPLRDMVLEGTHWLDGAEVKGKILRRAKACLGTRTADACDGGVVGVVGATPESLRVLSAGVANVGAPSTVAATRTMLQAEVDALRAEGLSVIVLLSHRQGVRNDIALVDGGLTGVDVIVSGGGENILADAGDRLLPGTTADPLCAGQSLGCYPLWVPAADGAPVAIVATDGDLKTVGALHVSFDDDGVITGADANSRPWILDEETMLSTRASVGKELLSLEQVTRAALEPLQKVVGSTPVYLEGGREHVRNSETNLGSLSADALLKAAQTKEPAVAAFRNGGAIRGSIGTITAGGRRDGKDITILDVRTALRFDSGVVVVDLTHAQLAANMEAALVGAGTTQGRFPQVSAGVHLRWSPAGVDQQQIITDGRVSGIACDGTHLVHLSLDTPDGVVVIVDNGVVQNPGANVKIATIDYLANGGDGWFPGLTVTTSPVPSSEQRAFTALLSDPALVGKSLASRDRITQVETALPAPACSTTP